MPLVVVVSVVVGLATGAVAEVKYGFTRHGARTASLLGYAATFVTVLVLGLVFL